MEANNFYMEEGSPFTGRKLQKLVDFLKTHELDYEPQIEYSTVLCDEDGTIIATGSLHSNVLKCIAISANHQGYGLLGQIITKLIEKAYTNNYFHLFLFTKPKNKVMFQDFGFYPIIETDTILFMENKKKGIRDYVTQAASPFLQDVETKKVGVIVANCNPFTKGHLYLIETAKKQCDLLHVFILQQDSSAFPTDIRFELVKKGCAHLKDVFIHSSSQYMISHATFPTYFIKDKTAAKNANCALDLEIFCEYFVKAFHISTRFVGEEPFCEVTRAYNEQMKIILPKHGIEVIEIPRFATQDTVVSATFVRKLFLQKDFDALKNLVPETTLAFLISAEGEALRTHLIEKMEKQNER